MSNKLFNFTLHNNPLDLDVIRGILTRLEDTIIFALIERAQFAHNPRAYERGAFQELKDIGFDKSWLEWFLKETESFQAKARRFTSPDEYPFTPITELPAPVLKSVAYPSVLYPNKVNVNPSIYSFYDHPPSNSHAFRLKRSKGVKGDDEYEDDGNYGSAATIDVEVLQAISKRVHYEPSRLHPHILNPNREALEALITKPEVERKLLQRLRKKALVYAQDFAPDGEPRGDAAKIDVDGVVELYESYIIPLTKEVEVDYLLARLDGLSQEQIDDLAKGKAASNGAVVSK
ncbi:chorismate mutase [Irpex lacteus]|nr:chorismate mutase [Irpex lacteus]